MMKPTAQPNSLSTWRERGANLLLLQPFMDSIIVRGDGCFLIDADGRRILDLAAGQFCSILGHADPTFAARMREQLERLVHLGDQYVSSEVLEATARLASVAPGNLTKAVLLSTGSEANECAMRMAKAVTQRTGMLGFSRGYYGISLATHNLSSISDHPSRHDFQPAPAGQHKLLTPSCERCPVGLTHDECTFACLDASLELLANQVDNIAAVIVEPVLSAGGMVFPSGAYLQRLRTITRELGILFIVDEAQTGFGRCGRWFDIQNHGVDPDMLVVSKTAGNGYPVAAVVVSDAIALNLESRGFTHLSSHQNDPLGAAALLAVIDIVEQRKLVDHSRAMGDYFIARLRELRERHAVVRDVRGRGLMIGVELAGADDGENPAFKAALLCERKGLHITFSYFEPVLRIIPPLVISRDEIDLAVSILDDALTDLERGTLGLLELVPENARSGPFVQRLIRTPRRELVKKIWNTSPRQWVDKVKSLRKRG